MDNLTQMEAPSASIDIDWCHGLSRIEFAIDDPKNIERTIRKITFSDNEQRIAFLRSLVEVAEAAIGQSEQQQDQSVALPASEDLIQVTLDSSDEGNLGCIPAFHFNVGQDEAGWFADVQVCWDRSNEIHQSISFQCSEDLMQFMGNLVAAAYFTFRDVQDQVQNP